MSVAANHSISLSATIRGDGIEDRVWDLDDSYRYCERIARSHYENFPVGSVIVPKHLRKYFYSIYAFARTADDFADEDYQNQHSEEERLDCLSEWLRFLRESVNGSASHPIFIALADTIKKFLLPIELFEDLLSAFSQDVTKRRYQTYDELLDYCRRSANPIGRLILLLFNHRQEALHRMSDDICTALQLANHWQDVRIDLEKDRVYLPLDDLSRFDIDVETLMERRSSDALRSLIEFECERAWSLFELGKPLCTAAPGRLGIELRAVWLGGTRILRGLKKNQYDVFSKRPVITTSDKLAILVGAVSRSSF